ncbi:MAG: hypothetical protein V1679_00895 [Candidatus Peregrinibacteria bacterium]
MKLIITTSIKEVEFEPLEKKFHIEIIKKAAKKSLSGLGKDIKNSSKIPSTSLKKLNITSSGGAGRVLFLLVTKNEDAILVMIREKSDKQIGSNMTVKNPKFKKILDKNINLIQKEIESDNYKEYDI